MDNDPHDNMRARAAQFRRLAELTHDPDMSMNLRRWADEVDRDVASLMEPKDD
jgi:hypothetical protein